MKMAPIRLMALLYAAHALQPLTILPVGRPLLPLDTISYGVDAKTFEALTAQRDDDRSPIVVLCCQRFEHFCVYAVANGVQRQQRSAHGEDC